MLANDVCTAGGKFRACGGGVGGVYCATGERMEDAGWLGGR